MNMCQLECDNYKGCEIDLNHFESKCKQLQADNETLLKNCVSLQEAEDRLEADLEKEKDNHAISIALMGAAMKSNDKLREALEKIGKGEYYGKLGEPFRNADEIAKQALGVSDGLF